MATQIIKIYRTRYNMHAIRNIIQSEGLLKSPICNKKITFNLARLKQFGGMPIELGNLNATRDWGLADNYTWECHVIKLRWSGHGFATGKLNSVREFLKLHLKQ